VIEGGQKLPDGIWSSEPRSFEGYEPVPGKFSCPLRSRKEVERQTGPANPG